MAAPPPPPELIEDAIAQILLCLPPDEPEHLFRAALVCKPWRRILTDPGFLRRYRAFHGAPPLLGLLHIPTTRGVYEVPFSRLIPIPTTSVPAFSRPAGTDRSCARILNCRHGRVLVNMRGGLAVEMDGGYREYLLVWEPVTGDTHALPRPDLCWRSCYTAAVSCDHLDCHGGPFRVVFVAAEMENILASMYTSETGAWSTRTSVSCVTSTSYLRDMRGTDLGDEVHFPLAPFSLDPSNTFATAKYEWGKKCLSVMNSPPPHPEFWDNYYFAVMAMEDSSLGIAFILDSSLYIYSRKVNTNGVAHWVQCRVIDLDKVMPIAKHCDDSGPNDVGFAEGVGAIFVSTGAGVFTIELKSGRVKKVDKPTIGLGHYFYVLPYMSFYTPDRGRLSSLFTGLPDV